VIVWLSDIIALKVSTLKGLVRNRLLVICVVLTINVRLFAPVLPKVGVWRISPRPSSIIVDVDVLRVIRENRG